MHPEPIRHHYIPQFILRNFCFEDERLHFFDKQTGHIDVKKTRDIFMERNLYRDESNNAADPVKIEKDLAAYEREIAQIIKERFLREQEFFLSPEEDAKIKLFFAIMGFRSLNASRCFGKSVSGQSKSFYAQWQPDGNILNLWKRNLGYIVQCRSFEEVRDHPHIDEPMKVFFHRDTIGYLKKYLAVAEAGGDNAFVIGDTYPVRIDGTLPNGVPLNVYDFFPLSPKRVLFVVSNGAPYAPREVLCLRNFIFQPPKYIEETNMLRIRVKKLCTDEVRYLNKEVVNTAQQGFAFHSGNISLPQIDQ